MPSNFPFVYFVIWTSAVICLNSGAPVKVKNGNVLDEFSTYFVAHKCRVLDSIVERPAGMDDPENFNISVPLEACSITELDDPVMPMCNEAFELITNLSTCRSDFETLNKALPLNEPINIAVQTDHVCEGLLANQSLFLRDPEFIAFKLGDKMLCSLVCSSKTLKACSFLLWGYRVQASLYGKTLPESGIFKAAVAEEDAKNETQENANDINSSLKDHIQEEQSQDNSLANNVLPNDEHQQKAKNLADQLKPPDSESAKDKSSPDEGQNDIADKKKSVLKVKSVNPKSTIVTSSSITRVAEKSTIRGNLSVSSDSSSNALPMQSSQNVTDVKAKSGATVGDGPHSSAATTLVHTKPHADKTSKGSVSTVPSSISNTVKKEKGKISEASSPSSDAFSVGGSADALLTGKDVNPVAGNEEGTPEMKDPGDKNVIAKENEIPDDDDDESPISENNMQTADDNPSEILHAGKITKETLSETPSSVAVIDMDDPKGDKSLQMDGNDGGGNIDNGGFDENGDPNTDFDDNSQLSQPEADDMENDAQGSASLVNSAAADSASKDIVPAAFPEQEDTHFFFYFISIVIFAIGGYVLFHNKQKIFALIIEGRHERRRRSGASYRKLETK